MNTTLITILTLAVLTLVVGLISSYCEGNDTDNDHFNNI